MRGSREAGSQRRADSREAIGYLVMPPASLTILGHRITRTSIQVREVPTMQRRSTGAAFLAFSAIAAPCAAQQGVLLRFAPPVGQVTHYRYLTQVWMQIPGVSSGDSSQPAMTQTMYATRTVTAKRDSTWAVTTVIDSSSGVTGDSFRGVIIKQRLGVHGTVDSTAVTTPPGADPMIAQAMQRSAGMANTTLSLPEGPVGVGQSWNESRSIPVPVMGGNTPVSVQVTYRLERVDHDRGARIAVISSTASLQMDTTLAAGFVKGTMNGAYNLDLDAGRLRNATTDVMMHITTKAAGPGTMRVHSVIESIP